MSVQKQRKIRRLKKKHVWSYVIAVLVFLLYFAIVTIAFETLFASYVVAIQIDKPYEDAVLLAGVIEDTLKEYDTSLNEDISVELTGDDDNEYPKCIVDENGKVIASNGKERPDEQTAFVVDIDDTAVLIEEQELRKSLYRKEGDTYSFNIMPVIMNTAKEAMSGEITDEAWTKQDAVFTGGWLAIPMCEGRYKLYTKISINITNGQIMFLLLILVFSIVVAVFPLIMFIVTAVSSILTQRRLSKLLYYDHVTGANNWLYFKENAGKLLKKTRNGSRYVVISIKVDKYRSYCACYGQADGEELLECIGRIIQARLGRKEMYARRSVSEFGVVMLADSPELLTERIERLHEELKTSGGGRKVAFNIGICDAVPGILNVEELYDCATLARNTLNDDNTAHIAWFNQEMRNEQLWVARVEENMEHALARREFQVYIQPKFDAATHKLGGAEALIRWISPVDGFIGPGKFIPIFEKNGFITRIDDYMLAEVAKLQAGWIAEGKEVVPISVNISRAHFSREDLAEHICSIVDSIGAPRSCIELELTESAFFDDKETLVNTVNKLKEMGFVISMDDFGAGYSSLNSLKDLPLDVVKLDAEFFRGDNAGEERGEIVVKEAIQLAKNLDMKIVAEGIETKEQVDFLAGQGCDLIQGFYFAKPMPVSDYEQVAFTEQV